MVQNERLRGKEWTVKERADDFELGGSILELRHHKVALVYNATRGGWANFWLRSSLTSHARLLLVVGLPLVIFTARLCSSLSWHHMAA